MAALRTLHECRTPAHVHVLVAAVLCAEAGTGLSRMLRTGFLDLSVPSDARGSWAWNLFAAALTRALVLAEPREAHKPVVTSLARALGVQHGLGLMARYAGLLPALLHVECSKVSAYKLTDMLATRMRDADHAAALQLLAAVKGTQLLPDATWVAKRLNSALVAARLNDAASRASCGSPAADADPDSYWDSW